MKDRPGEDREMPAEIDFSEGVRGLCHIPGRAKVFLPISIERSVGSISSKAEEKGIDLSELVTDVLKRDIALDEPVK